MRIAKVMALLKVGGKKVVMFLIMAIMLVILQNVVAVGVGYLTGVDPLIALLTGSTAMTGGHGTAAAMAPIVEELGHQGAKSVAIAAATFGLIAGSSLGGPLANRLIKGKKLEVVAEKVDNEKVKNDEFLFNNDVRKLDGENFAKAFFLILLSMFIGSYVSTFLNHTPVKGEKNIAVLEVDEATIKHITPFIQPKLFVFTNIFRDQMDRFGEIYTTYQ